MVQAHLISASKLGIKIRNWAVQGFLYMGAPAGV